MTESSLSASMKRLVVRLKNGARLCRAGGAFLLSGRRGPKTVVAPDLVEALLAEGLVAETPDGVAVTAAGERWLIGGDPQGAQHLELETRLIKDEAGRERYVVVNAAESPLALLRHRKLIGVVAFEAGDNLRRDYTIGQLTPRMGVDYSAPVGGRSFRPDLAETVLTARQRFNRALSAAGPGLAEVLFDVCCYLMTLEECEKNHAWPRGSARIVLSLALDRLAAHYGMTAPSRGRLRSWSKEG
jgi:hypothetical protein